MKRRATFEDTRIGASLNLVLIAQKDPGPVQVFTLPLVSLTWLLLALWGVAGKVALLGRVVLWPGIVLERARVVLLVIRVWGGAWGYALGVA